MTPLAMLACVGSIVVPRAAPRSLFSLRLNPLKMSLAELGVKAVSIPEELTFDDKVFPLTLTPTKSTPLAEWAATNRDELLGLIADNDAVLLRGFDAATCANDFSDMVYALQLEGFEMGCSAAPRTNLAPGVFTANEAPPSEPIPFHHEMAQASYCHVHARADVDAHGHGHFDGHTHVHAHVRACAHARAHAHAHANGRSRDGAVRHTAELRRLLL